MTATARRSRLGAVAALTGMLLVGASLSASSARADVALTPDRSISGNNTGMSSAPGATAITLGPDGTIYGTNAGPGNDSVLVYPADSTGNVGPTQQIIGANTLLDQPYGIAIRGDEVFVANNGTDQVLVFDVAATGNTAPIRQLTMAGTDQSPNGLVVTDDGDIAVTTTDGTSGQILIYDAEAVTGDEPARTISGANTLLETPFGIDVTADGNLIVTDQADKVLQFAALADGNVSPTTAITGDQTRIDNPLGIIGLASGETLATNATSSEVTEFAAADTGNLAPDEVFTDGDWVGIIGIAQHCDTMAVGNSYGVSFDFYDNLTPPTPTVSSASPTTVSTLGGTVFTVSGAGLAEVTTVTVDGTNADFVVLNRNALLVTAPAHAVGSVDVALSTACSTAVTATDAVTYAVFPPSAPASAIYQLKKRQKTVVRWDAAAAADSYRVYVGGRQRCAATTKRKCKVRAPLGPQADVTVLAANDGGDSSQATAQYRRSRAKVRYGKVRFAFNERKLTRANKKKVKRWTKTLVRGGFTQVKAVGHTNTAEANQKAKQQKKLSKKRARTVRKIMQKKARRMGSSLLVRAKGKGDKKSLKSPGSNPKNSRVEVILR